jgi:acyl-CoA synthetase
VPHQATVVATAPDTRMRERPAIILMLDGSAAPDLREHLETAGVVRQKWPEVLQPIVDFPRTASDKMQKYAHPDRLRHPGI